MPVWSQVQPSAYGGSYELDSEHMMTPPPVSRGAYPSMAGSEERSNFLSGGVVFSAAYSDNLMLLGSTADSDETYAILPTIALDRRTPRHSETIRYGAGFRFYQNTSQLNAVTQDGTASFQYRFTPYSALIINDSVAQNSNLYNQANPFGSGGLAGSPGSSNVAFIEPYADEITNSTNAGLEYQYSKNSMVGVNGSYSFLQFSGHSFLPILSDQDTAGGNAFYSRRFGKSYAGATYQLSKYVTHPFGSYTLSHTVFGFYTHYFTRTISISLLGGPEHYTSWTETTPKSSAWTPAAQGSIGWQVRRGNLAANFAHVVSGAGGLIGTFHSDTGGLRARMMFTRKWSGGVHAEYSHYSNLSSVPSQFAYFPGGNSISGGVEVARTIRESLAFQAEYLHLHQNYGNVTTSSSLQDSNQASIGISYQFNRPLGR
jgi:hypothetical protein